MAAVNLRRVDLNLLVMLDMMLEERHVTRAADRLALTQSAASNALERLRHLFEDPLLVRTHGGMRLTAYAESIREPLRVLMTGAQNLLCHATAFDPSQARGPLRVAMPEFVSSLLLPELLKTVAAKAPGLELSVHPMISCEAAQAMLEGNGLDLIIAVFDGFYENLHRAPLLSDLFVCLMRSMHPASRGRLTARRLGSYPSVVLSGLAPVGYAGSRLPSQPPGRSPLSVPHCMVIPALLEDTDTIALVPKRIARRYSPPLAVRSAPLDIPPICCEMAWHSRSAGMPQQVWLRREIHQIAQRL